FARLWAIGISGLWMRSSTDRSLSPDGRWRSKMSINRRCQLSTELGPYSFLDSRATETLPRIDFRAHRFLRRRYPTSSNPSILFKALVRGAVSLGHSVPASEKTHCIQSAYDK